MLISKTEYKDNQVLFNIYIHKLTVRRFNYSKIQESWGIFYKNGFSIQFIVNLDTPLCLLNVNTYSLLVQRGNISIIVDSTWRVSDCEELSGGGQSHNLVCDW